MRRKEQYITKWALIGFAGTAGVDILVQLLEHLLDKKPFTWESYNGNRTLKNAFIGCAIGAGVGYLAYQTKLSEEARHPFNSDEYLKKVLSEENLKSDPLLLKKYLSYKAEIKEWLNRKFDSRLICKAEDAGSFFKRTAIASNTDLDIVLAFRNNSYATLEEMYYHVYDCLQAQFEHKAIVTKQTKAIGLTFEHNCLPIHFDIVPGREVGDYKVTKELNLYVRADWAWQKGSSFKTNIGVQKTITVNKPEARRVIRLLKTYKVRNGMELPSVIIDQCVVESLSDSRFGVHFSDTENLLNSMNFIARKMQQNNYSDTANSNNNLNSKLNSTQRHYLAEQLYNDVERIEENPRYIKEIFTQ
jgi:hypothetical protein